MRNLSIKVKSFFYSKIAKSFKLKEFAISEAKNDLFFEFERFGNLSWGKNDWFRIEGRLFSAIPQWKSCQFLRYNQWSLLKSFSLALWQVHQSLWNTNATSPHKSYYIIHINYFCIDRACRLLFFVKVGIYVFCWKMHFYECIITKSKLDQYRHRESMIFMVWEHHKKERGSDHTQNWVYNASFQSASVYSQYIFGQSFKRIKGSSTLNLDTFI